MVVASIILCSLFAVLLVMYTPLKYVITSLFIRAGWYRAFEMESLGLYQPAFDYPQWRFKGNAEFTAYNLIDGDGNEILTGIGKVLILVPTWRIWLVPVLGWSFEDLVVSR
jgi:hypothetical protein